MRVERSLQRKVCIDGSLMKEFVLSGPLTRDLADYLGNFGKVEILPLHGKQLLSFENPRFISVKGVLGEDTVEVRYVAGVHDLAADLFHLFLYHYSNGKETGKTTPCVLAGLKPGEHTISLVRQGYQVQGGAKTVTVKAGTESSVEFTLSAGGKK